jgi:hypothetical protein
MNGKKMRLELVEKPKTALAPAEVPEEEETAAASSGNAPGEDPPPPGQAKVISLKDMKGRSD